MKKQKVLNFFAGPGTGKSTVAAYVFAELKLRGYNVELVTEVAKEATWEERGSTFFAAQDLIFAKQHFKMKCLEGKTDLIITDSPLLLSLIYQEPGNVESLANVYLDTANKYDNVNVRLQRNPSRGYNQSGRNQSETEAHDIDKDIELLPFYCPGFKYDLEMNVTRSELLVLVEFIITWADLKPKISEVR